ncbi:hypothetical protein CAP48_19030 [Advenella sp. S44]|uniref:Bug family tripartite tricarboxylate transporter substrate binding protein n=1 Tax=Advenella sp. S44 TaxID=1982755 RepID=UPI000C2A41DC|nr:tripartite tricarboxylate transporter substrate binding protein [Advenella sp. S44]PJX20495.1 hypothetical protein CAP48_19030 [Advenella sp. S44]
MKHVSRRALIKAIGALPFAISGTAMSAAHAKNEYPINPITLVLPVGPGNTADIIGRLLAQHLGASIGTQIVVENRPGAGGISAVKHVGSAKPDGYSLMYMGAGSAISQTLFKPQPFNLIESFTPITTITSNDVILVTGKNSSLSNIGDFLDKSRKTPGGLMVGISLLGTIQHLTAETFKSMAGIEMTIVPYKTASAVSAALASGDIELAFEFVPPMLGQIQNGLIKALAISNADRSKILPTVPTLAEQGFTDFNVASWGMIVAPNNTPDTIVQYLNKHIHSAIGEPDVMNRLTELGVRVQLGTADEANALLSREIVRWKTVIDQTKVSLT